MTEIDDRRKAFEELARLSDELGLGFGEEFKYGICPAQVSGITSDGRPFYYRCRHSYWTLQVGEPGWHANSIAWPVDWPHPKPIASGPGDIERGEEVDALLDQYLGPGWRVATWEEIQYDETCKCGRVFRTTGSTICSPCFQELLLPDDD